MWWGWVEKGEYYRPIWSKRCCCPDSDIEFQETANSCVTTCDNLKENKQFIKDFIWNHQEASFQFILNTSFFIFLLCLQICLFKKTFQKKCDQIPCLIYTHLWGLRKHSPVLFLNIKVDDKLWMTCEELNQQSEKTPSHLLKKANRIKRTSTNKHL